MPAAGTAEGRVVAALDLGPSSDAVSDVGCAVARALGQPLELVHVVDEPRWLEEIGGRLLRSAPVLEALVSPVAAQRADAAGALEAARARCASQGVSCAVTLRRGPPYRLLAEQATATAASVVVVGPHQRARPGEGLLGTTTDRLLRLVERPTWVLPPPSAGQGAEALRGGRWVVGVDFSPGSAAAVAHAARLARALDAPVTLAHALPRLGEPAADREDATAVLHARSLEALRAQALEDLGALAAAAGLERVDLRVEPEEPCVLLERAAPEGTVLCVGATGRGAIARALLGTTVQRCLRGATRHVVVVPVAGP